MSQNNKVEHADNCREETLDKHVSRPTSNASSVSQLGQWFVSPGVMGSYTVMFPLINLSFTQLSYGCAQLALEECA